MQWLIDICKEAMTDTINALKAWVEAKGYLTTSFVDRGDPSMPDFTKGDFTTNYAWHDLDLSGIIPAGAKAVCFSLYWKSPTAAWYGMFRKKGNSNDFNVARGSIQVATLRHDGDFVCPLGADRVLEYKFTAGTWTVINLTIKGWWL